MRVVVHGTIIGLALCLFASASAKDTHWHARLATVPIDPTTAASVTGHGEAAADLRGRELRISGSFTGLAKPATIAQLHEGPYTGVRGEVIADLSVSQSVAGTISASIELTPKQIDALRAGHLYIQIHSQSAPDGNLWGWLLP